MIEAKLGDDVLARVRAAPDDHPHPVIVRYRTTRQGRGRVAAFRLIDDLAISIDHHYTVVPAVAGRATRRQISALSDDPTVEMVWYDSPVHTLLDASVPLIGAPQLWPSGLTGKGIKICIVDTGIDFDHPDFAGRIAATRDFTGEGVKDGHGHGTHVASTAAGSGAASDGKYRGVAPDANLLIAKVMTANGAGSTSDVMAGVEWAVQQGAHVINLSLGSDGSCDGSDALSQTCDAAVQRGHAVCIAAGNAGPNAATVGSPGCAHQAITIGATDDDDAIASFSSRGPTADGRVKPDVCFPGVRIVAARAKGTSMGRAVDDFYTSASGTSMATPHASGTCALLAQAHPSTTPAQVKDALMKTAKNLRLDGNVVGAGRAQVVDAVHLLGRVPAPQPVPPPAPTPAPVTPPSPAPPIPQPPRRGCLPAAVVLMMRALTQG